MANAISCARQLTYFDFDLNRSSIDRWKPILDHYQDQLPTLCQACRSLLSQYKVIVALIRPFCLSQSTPFDDDITYLAERIGLTISEIWLMQLLYETPAIWTSNIIEYGDHKQQLLFMAMDSQLTLLKQSLIGLTVKRGHQVIGQAITYLGAIGLMTVVNVDRQFTVAVNYQQSLTILDLLKSLHRMGQTIWPMSFLIRQLIERNVTDVIAFNYLQLNQIASPCYLLFHYHQAKSYVMTRDWDQCVNIRETNLMQTQSDKLYSQRKREIMVSLDKLILDNRQLKPEQLIQIITRYPVINEETIYFMCLYKGLNKVYY